MIVYAGVQNTSFAAGRADLSNLARLEISEKQVERVTERIGQERVDQREKQVQAFLALPNDGEVRHAGGSSPRLGGGVDGWGTASDSGLAIE